MEQFLLWRGECKDLKIMKKTCLGSRTNLILNLEVLSVFSVFCPCEPFCIFVCDVMYFIPHFPSHLSSISPSVSVLYLCELDMAFLCLISLAYSTGRDLGMSGMCGMSGMSCHGFSLWTKHQSWMCGAS